MFFCDDCRVKKNWPNSAVVTTERCEACGKTVECYEVPSIRLVSEAERTVEQKLVFKIMQEAFQAKAGSIIVTNRDGRTNHALTDKIKKVVVKRDNEIDWFDTYQLRLALLTGIQMDEESKRNRRV